MRIVNINIPKDKSNLFGLEAIKMNRLGEIVVLAGKNGSGKSRLLQLIMHTAKQFPPSQSTIRASQIERQVEKLNEDINEQLNNIKEFAKELNINLPNIDYIKDINEVKELEGVKNDLNRIVINFEQDQQYLEDKDRFLLEKVVDNFEQIINNKILIDSQNRDLVEIKRNNLIEIVPPEANCLIIEFVPKDISIKDTDGFTKAEEKKYALEVDQLGVDSLAIGAIARIQKIQNEWFSSTHFLMKERLQSKHNDDYEKLNRLINLFLREHFDRNNDDEVTIFGFPIGKAHLSDGQKVMLQFCLAVHCQQKFFGELIIFLDEPENHLHPAVVIEMIEQLKKINPNGQIWIATHSISLISYFDPSTIWFVENNEISYSGSIPTRVLTGLLGSEEHLVKLQDFLNLPAIHALHQYAFECLTDPKVLMTTAKDPQSGQAFRVLIQNTQHKIRILDFGAGKGRLLSNLIELIGGYENFKNKFDYFAFDKFVSNKEDCLTILKKVYKDGDKRYFSDSSELFSCCDKESFDIVLMCNVLHEIDPKEWLTLFGGELGITKILKSDGCLLLIEDQEMPFGEKAYQKGFIVLDTGELKTLFKIKEDENGFMIFDERNDGRLKAFLIKREYLTRIDEDSRKTSLKQLKEKALKKIRDIRSNSVDYKTGKKHGFWIQQLANSMLCLEEETVR